MLEVKALTAQQWLLLKSIRLKALADSPEAFCTTLSQAQSWPDAEWQARAARFAVGTREIAWIAYLDAMPCGMTTCYLPESAPIPTAGLAAVWVDPRFRRHGVGEAMVDAAAQWSASRGAEALEAVVTALNGKAIAFYERIGFVRRHAPSSPDDEVLLVRELPGLPKG